jgi:hypothetical protein
MDAELQQLFVDGFKVGARNTEAVKGIAPEFWQTEEALENEARLIWDGFWRERQESAKK